MSFAHTAEGDFSPTPSNRRDRRLHKRVPLTLKGRFLNDESQDFELTTSNLSCSGALLHTHELPAPPS